LYGYEGVYPTTVSEFARCFGDGVRFFNREDDAGDKGLRTSKLQYLPARLADKLCLKTQNELQRIAEIPTLSTARLTLSAFEEKDKAAYNAICLDDERNKWWGYDYRKDYDGSPIEDYFLKVTREDFAARVAANFAIRLNGECIGEAVLYRFDAKGTAELGCRIAPAFAHSGYGTEAFAAVADWALYQLQLRAVVAKCYKENQASFRMLSSCMRRAGEDDTFFYFRKEV
ncbi:MAG: GNAT family N-acetyltransferase, partial [Oscillospiraceae bacterium]|nr:GNAT family N-acetyltransferase [Oscillospiraceae bacterium]